MDVLETRAGDLLDRLTDCGLGSGLTEEDLYGRGVREPLRTCCTQLAHRLWALCLQLNLHDLRVVQTAVNDLRQAAISEQASASGRLDAASIRLLQALDPTFEPSAPAVAADTGPAASVGATASPRLEVLELLVAWLQGATSVVAARQAQQASTQAPGSSNHQGGAAAGAAAVPTAAVPAAVQQTIAGGSAEADMQDPLAVELSRALHGLAALLELPRPGGGWPSAAALTADLHAALGAAVAQLPPGFFEPLLPPGSLSAQQLETLTEVNQALHDEYALRRRMLTERVRVTLQSFLWSGRLKEQGTQAQAQAVVDGAAQLMGAEPAVTLEDVLRTTAGDLLAVMERATSGESGVEASVKAVLIGAVPDRGGRPEGRARVADMPAWAPRRVSDGGGRGGRCGHRGSGGGGRVQGGWQGGGSREGGGSSGAGKGGQWAGSGRGAGGRGGQFEFQGSAKRGRSGH